LQKIGKAMKKFFDLKNITFQSILLITVTFILLLAHFSPITFGDLEVGGADVRGSKGETQLVSEWQKKSGETALWNPSIFSGLPNYYKKTRSIWNFDTIIIKSSHLFSSKKVANLFGMYLVGIIGMFLLFRYFGFSPVISIFGSISFVMSIHWAILLEVGHFAKFRPIMMIPLVLWSFFKMTDKLNLLSTSFFAFILASQIRTMHYQIIFYTALLLLFLGIWKLYEKYKEGQWTKLLLFTSISLLLTFGMVTQQLMMTGEFAKTTMRGGNGEIGAKKTTGLAYDYATTWSLNPAEMGEFLVPRASGGGNRETYDGGSPEFKHLVGQKIPGYFGEQPIREGSADYLGITIIFLGIIGLLVFYKESALIRTLSYFAILSVLIAFGKHSPFVYDLFYNYAPYFNKFRIPSMILVLWQVLFVIFAGFGLQALSTKEKTALKKPLFISSGIILFIFAFLYFSTNAFIAPHEVGRAEPAQIKALITLRQDLFYGDLQRQFIFLILLFVATFVYLMGYVKESWKLASAMILFVIIDAYQMHNRYMLGKNKNGQYVYLSKPKNYDKTVFRKTKTDEFLLSEKRKDLDFAEWRIYPITQSVWQTNDFSYYHQSIGGYSAAKMRIQQDLWDFGKINNSWIFTRQIPDMLNAKYFIVDAKLPESGPFRNLELVHSDQKRNVYKNLSALGKAWFVDSVEIIPDKQARLKRLHSFSPAKSVILEKDFSKKIEKPTKDSVFIKKYTPNELEIYAENDKNSFLVISDIFYPKGWKTFVNNKETEIFQSNHVLRGIYLPAGKNQIKMVFMPESYAQGNLISLWSTIIAFGLFLFGLYRKKELFVKS
jgi:hypothetical protein